MDLWNNETPIVDLDTYLKVPAWIDKDISPSDVAAIVQGGCESGAHIATCNTRAQAHATIDKLT